MTSNNTPRLILASSSLSRQKLMRRLHLPFEIMVPDIDESPYPNEDPESLVLRLAEQKAEKIASLINFDALIIGSDSTGYLNGAFIGKPETHPKAVEQLLTMSGHTIPFYTGLCVLNTKTQKRHLTCEPVTVKMRSLTRPQIEAYLAREGAYHCAGSFNIESFGIILVESVTNQDPNTLVGLPLIQLITYLLEENFPIF